MKKTFLLILVFILGDIGTSFAQRQKMTESDAKETGYGTVLPGNKTYYYIVGEDGSQQLDGPYSVNCPQSTYSVSIWPYTYKITGSYSMTANHSKGKLHGAINSDYKIAVSRSDGQSENEFEKMSGNFTNGIPNGQFVVNSKCALNATYANGILVGAFSCKVVGDEGLPHNWKGNLTSKGALNGTWTYQDGTSQGTMQFQNGVLISNNVASSGKSTPPAISALAKQYATGAITKESLSMKGYEVFQSEIKLGEYAYICIVVDSGVDFGSLGSYSFKQNAVVYEYIEQVCYLNKEGVEKLVADLVDKGESNLAYRSGDKYGCIQTDNNGKPYIVIHSADKQYVSGFFDEYLHNVYIKDEDMAYIDAKIAENAKPLMNFVDDIARYSSVTSNIAEEQKLDKLQKTLETFNDKKFEVTEGVYRLHTTYTGWIFISANSVKEVEDAIAELEVVVKQKKEEQKIAAEQARLEREEAVRQEAMARLKPAFNFIQSNSKAFTIVYDENFSRYMIYNKKNVEYWKLEAEEIMKPFCPMVAYEIINIDQEYVTCKWSVQGKKKIVSTYELKLKHKDGKLVIDEETFNINTAKKIE